MPVYRVVKMCSIIIPQTRFNNDKYIERGAQKALRSLCHFYFSDSPYTDWSRLKVESESRKDDLGTNYFPLTNFQTENRRYWFRSSIQCLECSWRMPFWRTFNNVHQCGLESHLP